MKITKAVIPVAGRGTRFLPATKEIPKEMIPIVNTPMIHYSVLEAVESGVEQIIFINSSGKSSIEDYFDRNLDLEYFLEKNKKYDLLEKVKNIGSMIEVVSVRQKEQLGLGHAINCAKHLIGNETFAVILGDDLVLNKKTPVTKQLMDVSERHNGKSVIGVMEVSPDQTDKYGIVDGSFVDNEKLTLKMKNMIEKPSPDQAPTNLATPGRYVLTSDIFDCLDEIPRGVGGEYQLTDAINLLASRNDVYAHIYKGDRFDTGSLNGYLDATVEFALRDESTRKMMETIIKEKIKTYGITL